MSDSDIDKARTSDLESIRAVLEELELYHPSLEFGDFWVMREDERIVGVTNLRDCGSCAYMSAVGVVVHRRGKGIARSIVRKAIDNLGKDIYIYTVVPNFFMSMGFVPTEPSNGIPPRGAYDCSSCSPEECVCMVLRR